MTIDLTQFIEAIGYAGLFAVIFSESGMLVGFFLPGDSVLFTAGILASRGFFNVWVVLVGCYLAAVVGDSIGYALGLHYGRKIFQRENSLLFDKRYVEQAEKFYEKHGKKTIILARFMPFIRTFAPVVAGIARMDYRTFVAYNVVGGFIWAFGNTLIGYYLGKAVPDLEQYAFLIAAIIVLLTLAQPTYHLLRNPESRAALRHFIARRFGKA